MSKRHRPTTLTLVGPPQTPDLAEDGRLAQAAIDGRPGARRALWVRFFPMVRRLTQRQIGPDVDVDDVVQDIFVVVFRDLGSLREARAVGSFIGSVAVHHLHRELRRRRLRRMITLTRDGVAPEPEPRGDDPVARLALKRVYALLDRFRTTERMVFILRNIEGQGVDDVAAALDLSPATVKRKSAHVFERLSKLVRRDPFLSDYLQEGSHDEP